jgi:flagellar basal body P-ring formation protein FlgA
MPAAPIFALAVAGIPRDFRPQCNRGLRTVAAVLFAFLAAPVSSGSTVAGADAASAVASAVLTREQLLGQLARDLISHFNLVGDLQLELLRPSVLPAEAAAAWTVRIVEYPVGPSSSMLLRCRVSADSQPAAEMTVLLRASLWREAWVSRQPIALGSLFEPSELEVRRVDFLRERDLVPAEMASGGYVFARYVAAARLLTWRDLARRPLVRKGELVEVAAGEGMLRITLKALAMQNGAQGDTILLRNPVSQKNFSALVVDENRVQVIF